MSKTPGAVKQSVIARKDGPNDRKLALKFFARLAVFPLAYGLFIFLPAGTLNYIPGWIYFAALAIPIYAGFTWLFFTSPRIIERRMKYREKDREQKVLMGFYGACCTAGFILPGLDFRFHWSSMPLFLSVAGGIATLLGFGMMILVFRQNAYAARTVEVEKGQKVVSSGLYSVVRHPMYLSALITFLGTPLALGSYWAMIPFYLSLIILPFRIVNEEKMLRKGLPGYAAYCGRTRFRLIPGVW